MTERRSRPAGTLVVEYRGHEPVELPPASQEFTFGRGRGCSLVIARDDHQISRRAGTIWWVGGQWWVRNDSASHPYDVITPQGIRNILAAHRPPAPPSRWHVAPPRLRIRVEGPLGPYDLTLTVHDDQVPYPLPPDPPTGPPTTKKTPTPTLHARRILAAKFLSTPTPGEAIGDQEAADYVNASPSRSLTDPPVTAKAVETCVSKCRERLQRDGVLDIDGRSNINTLGLKLLAYGYLRLEDRRLL